MHYHVRSTTAPVYERARWTRDRAKVDGRVGKWRRNPWYDGETERFALSKGRVEEEEEDDDDMWEVMSGGFPPPPRRVTRV